jgi:hypothetical protein
MSLEQQQREHRRGERVLLRVPTQVRGTGADGKPFDVKAETVMVSRFGALLRVSVKPKKGTTLKATNIFSSQTEEFRVAYVGEFQTEGKWDAGVEAVNPRDDFWGIRFPPPPAVKP